MIYHPSHALRLRSPERSDIPRFVVWLNDPEVRHGIALYLPMSEAAETAWFERMLTHAPEEQVMVIEIQVEGAWEMVGTCSLMEINWRNRGAEVGILIGEKTHWNQGHGTACMRLLLKHSFETLNLHRIFLRVYADNLRAVRAYEKAGFVHEGRLRDDEFRDGAYKDVLIMSVLRPEWRAAQAAQSTPS